MKFFGKENRRGGQEQTSLLRSDSGRSYSAAESEEQLGLSPDESIPSLPLDDQREPSAGLTLNLELGPDEPHLNPSALRDTSPEIHDIFTALKTQEALCQDLRVAEANFVKLIKKLDKEEKREMDRAPIFPPKGTWFAFERKQYDEKKREHDQALSGIQQHRQQLIDQLAVVRRKISEAEYLAMRSRSTIRHLGKD